MAKRKDKNKFTPDLPDLLDMNPVDIEETFIRYLFESGELADELEFEDLVFDDEKTLAIVEKTHKKYARRLKAAEKKGGEELEFLQDDMRIETIEKIITSEIRKEILHRLDLLVSRLKESHQLKKNLMATAVRTVLAQGDFPWGACNLVVAIFQRTISEALPDEDEQRLIGELINLLGEDLTPEELDEKLHDPTVFSIFEEKVKANPELFDRMTAISDKIIDEFIEDIWHGKVEIDLFTSQEIEAFFERFHTSLDEAGIDPETDQSSQVPEIFIEALHAHLKELLAAERVRQIKQDLQAISTKWFQTGHKYAVTLQIEIEWLDEGDLLENTFLSSVFAVQTQRFAVERADQAEQSGQKPRRRRRQKKK